VNPRASPRHDPAATTLRSTTLRGRILWRRCTSTPTRRNALEPGSSATPGFLNAPHLAIRLISSTRQQSNRRRTRNPTRPIGSLPIIVKECSDSNEGDTTTLFSASGGWNESQSRATAQTDLHRQNTAPGLGPQTSCRRGRSDHTGARPEGLAANWAATVVLDRNLLLEPWRHSPKRAGRPCTCSTRRFQRHTEACFPTQVLPRLKPQSSGVTLKSLRRSKLSRVFLHPPLLAAVVRPSLEGTYRLAIDGPALLPCHLFAVLKNIIAMVQSQDSPCTKR